MLVLFFKYVLCPRTPYLVPRSTEYGAETLAPGSFSFVATTPQERPPYFWAATFRLRSMRLRCPLLLSTATLSPLLAMHTALSPLRKRLLTQASSSPVDYQEGDHIHLPWSVEDDRLLYEAFSQNKSFDEICAITKRGRGGVQARLKWVTHLFHTLI